MVSVAHATHARDARSSASVRAGIGVALLACAWAVSWSSWEPFRHHTFFPLWLGYILLVDGLTALRFGTSLYQRGRVPFALLFAVSAPAWWLFELLNIRLRDWVYILPHEYSWISYHLQASLAFSTVIPAVFCTSELVRRTVLPRSVSWLTIAPGWGGLIAIGAVGAGMVLLTQVAPDIFFPLVWIGLFLLLDPIARLIGRPSIAGQVTGGRWDTVFVLWFSTLWCGFLWEMWNSRAMPKWTYEIPYAEWLRVFEMPILGYGGYLAFGLELYALYRVVSAVLPEGLVSDLRFDCPVGEDLTETAPRS